MRLDGYIFEDVTSDAIRGIVVGACFAFFGGAALGPSVAVFAISSAAATAFAHLTNSLINKEMKQRLMRNIEVCSIALHAAVIVAAGLSMGVIGVPGSIVVSAVAIIAIVNRLQRSNEAKNIYNGI